MYPPPADVHGLVVPPWVVGSREVLASASDVRGSIIQLLPSSNTQAFGAERCAFPLRTAPLWVRLMVPAHRFYSSNDKDSKQPQ